MFWNKYFFPSFIILLFVTALHWIASIYGFYDNVKNFDVLMHFLGGLWILVFALWAVNTEYGVRLLSKATTRNLLLFVFIVGILWEIHELIFGFEDLHRIGYAFDTVKDLVMDMIGGSVGIFFFKK